MGYENHRNRSSFVQTPRYASFDAQSSDLLCHRSQITAQTYPQASDFAHKGPAQYAGDKNNQNAHNASVDPISSRSSLLPSSTWQQPHLSLIHLQDDNKMHFNRHPEIFPEASNPQEPEYSQEAGDSQETGGYSGLPQSSNQPPLLGSHQDEASFPFGGAMRGLLQHNFFNQSSPESSTSPSLKSTPEYRTVPAPRHQNSINNYEADAMALLGNNILQAEPTSEPYATLIFKALRSAPGNRMILKEIYKWFENNTDKNKNGTKGWQNSIRHNLSMNAVGSAHYCRYRSCIYFARPSRRWNNLLPPKMVRRDTSGCWTHPPLSKAGWSQQLATERLPERGDCLQKRTTPFQLIIVV